MRRIAGLLAAAALGCGSGSGSTAAGTTFNGTVHGQPMKPAEAISMPATVSLGTVSANVLAIALADAAGACAKVGANTEPKNGKALVIFLADFNNFVTSPPSGTGTFSIYNPSGGLPPPHVAVATFTVNDESCKEVPALSATATSGSVKLTSGSGGAYSGTYTIGFETGEQVSGEFHTADCPGLATYFSSDTHFCG